MFIPAFDHSIARYDHWRMFHINHHPYTRGGRGSVRVTTLPTGEAILRAETAGAIARGANQTFGFTIGTASELVHVYTSNKQLTLPDGTPLSASEVDGTRHQVLYYDYDTGHVVSTHSPTRSYDPWKGGLIPPHLRPLGEVYIAGAGLPPQATVPVRYGKVMPSTTPEKRHVNALRHAARLWCTLFSGQTWIPGDWMLRKEASEEDIIISRKQAVALPIAKVLACTVITDLTERERLCLASFGVTYDVDHRTTPYLLLAPRIVT